MESPPVVRDESPLQPGDHHARSPIEMARAFTRSWGPFPGFVATIVTAAFIALQLARTDTVAIVIGVVTVVALIAAYLANNKKAS